MIVFLILAGVYCLHILLKMHWITTGILTVYFLIMLASHRKRYHRMLEQKLRFDEASEYLDALLYAFCKQEKVERALADAEAALADGPMREVVRDALAHMHMTFDDTDVMRESLQLIEEQYPCARIRTAHAFILHVESYGGQIERPIKLLLADKKRWEKRTLLAMKERSKMFTDIVMSIAASLIICGMILYLPVMNMDISQNVLCQILTGIVLILDDWIFLRAQRFMEEDWLKLDVVCDDDGGKRMEEYRNYNPKRDRLLSIVLAVPCGIGMVVSIYFRKEALVAICVLLLLLMLNQHRVGRHLARRSLIKRIRVAFPNWLLDIVLLLQSENVQVAILKSREHVPGVLEKELDLLAERLAMEPESAEPYHAFLQGFEIAEVHSAMSMLFSLSMGHSNQGDRQLGELIDRNLEMLDAAEKERISNLSSGMYLLFLAPVVTASVKLVIDMAVFMLSFLGSAGIG